MEQIYTGNCSDFGITLKKINKDIEDKEMDEIFYKFLVEPLSNNKIEITGKNFYYYNGSQVENIKQEIVKNSKILKCYIDSEKYAGFNTPANTLLKKLLRKVITTEAKDLEKYKKTYGINMKKIGDRDFLESFKSHIKDDLYYQYVNISTLLKCLVKICDFHCKKIEICLANDKGVFYIKNF